MSYIFTSESVSAGHPDKVADQISDAILDNYLALDPKSHVAIETLVTTNRVIVSGEVKSNAKIDTERVIRETIASIGYTNPDIKFDTTCIIENYIHEQSEDIARGVDTEEQGAGDQGIMFGFATNETKEYMPLSLYLANEILMEIDRIRKEGKTMKYLRPDAKSQVTVEYEDDGTPKHIHTIVISIQHDEFVKPTETMTQEAADITMHNVITYDMQNIVLFNLERRLPSSITDLIDEKTRILVNPTGKFVIGGPDGDTGLTGRKIIVDTYGGRGAHGGGAFSGKDPSKVDRSAAYAARHIAKNIVAAGLANEALVQLSYAIGVAKPISIYLNTNGTNKTKYSDAELANKIYQSVDLKPKSIEERFHLRTPKYLETASYGHFGKSTSVVTKKMKDNYIEVELFSWEELDLVETFKTWN